MADVGSSPGFAGNNQLPAKGRSREVGTFINP